MIIPPAPMQQDPKDQTELRKALSDMSQQLNTSINKITGDIGGIDATTYGITSGSNANGNWIKFPDGTMECWYQSSVLRITSSADTGGYYAVENVTFPIAFISPPVVNTAHKQSNGQCWGGPAVITATGCGMYIASTSNVVNAYIGYRAIGKWK